MNVPTCNIASSTYLVVYTKDNLDAMLSSIEELFDQDCWAGYINDIEIFNIYISNIEENGMKKNNFIRDLICFDLEINCKYIY